jgi:hypothetical protein
MGKDELLELLKQEEFGLHEEYDYMKRAIRLIETLRSKLKRLRKIQQNYGSNPFPEKVKGEALRLYSECQTIFKELIDIEFHKIGPKIKSTFEFFEKDIQFLKQKGFIRFPQF